MFALFQEKSNMNPLITEVRSSLPYTDLTAKGDDISRVKFQVGIVPSTKTVSTSFIYYSFRSHFNNFWEFYSSPPPPRPLLLPFQSSLNSQDNLMRNMSTLLSLSCKAINFCNPSLAIKEGQYILHIV